MTLHDLTTLCGNAHMTKLSTPRVTFSHISSNYEQSVHWGEFGSKWLDA